MTEIVVLGAGIGGISMAYELRALIGRKANITLLSDSEWFHFVPSNQSEDKRQFPGGLTQTPIGRLVGWRRKAPGAV
jgi:NADH dehydrogenase FAD-containing subunit